tara:strand:- start:101 stop:322 length:222 start_codon:yes stop_codon:yes gene_type:complete
MDEIKTFLIKSDRYDLLAILETFLDEIGYDEDDSDYEPPESVNEPIEEYLDGALHEEDIYQVDTDSDGFLSLK